MAEQGGGGRNPGWIPTDDDAAAACSMALQTVVRISLLWLNGWLQTDMPFFQDSRKNRIPNLCCARIPSKGLRHYKKGQDDPINFKLFGIFLYFDLLPRISTICHVAVFDN